MNIDIVNPYIIDNNVIVELCENLFSNSDHPNINPIKKLPVISDKKDFESSKIFIIKY